MDIRVGEKILFRPEGRGVVLQMEIKKITDAAVYISHHTMNFEIRLDRGTLSSPDGVAHRFLDEIERTPEQLADDIYRHLARKLWKQKRPEGVALKDVKRAAKLLGIKL